MAADPLALHFEGSMLSRHHMARTYPLTSWRSRCTTEEWSDARVVGLVTLAPEARGDPPSSNDYDATVSSCRRVTRR